MLSYLLNNRIVIEKGTQGVSNKYTPIIEYETYCEVWANVYIRSISAVSTNINEDLLYVTEFIVRNNKITQDVNNKYRILYNDQYYKIIEVVILNDQFIKFICRHYEYE